VVSDSVVYSLVMIPWNEEGGRRLSTVEKVMAVLGEEVRRAHTAYVDYEVMEIDGLEGMGVVIPCWSIWGMMGSERLAAVLLFERLC
jgi:hypothetical protein